MSETLKQRSAAWYLLPVFLTIIGGIIAYFIIKRDDPKKAKNCMYLGIVLTAAGVGLTVISGVIAYNDIQNSPFGESDNADDLDVGYATSSEIVVSDNSQINKLAENIEYDYNIFGLKVNHIQLQDKDGNVVTEIQRGSKYTIVSEIQNRENVEKEINYSININHSDVDFGHSMGAETTISAQGVLHVDLRDVVLTVPGVYDVEVWVEDASMVEKVYDDLKDNPDGEWPQPFWRMVYLE